VANSRRKQQNPQLFGQKRLIATPANRRESPLRGVGEVREPKSIAAAGGYGFRPLPLLPRRGCNEILSFYLP
jgi:hypothetical protein